MKQCSVRDQLQVNQTECTILTLKNILTRLNDNYNASLYKKEIIKDLQTGKRRYIWPLSYIKDMRFN